MLFKGCEFRKINFITVIAFLKHTVKKSEETNKNKN